MKRLKLLLQGFIVSCIALCSQSCNQYSEDINVQADYSNEFNETLLTLQRYNDSLPNNPLSRRIGRTGRIAVVLADVGGAVDGAKMGASVGTVFFGPHGTVVGTVIGAVITGTARSYTVYRIADLIDRWRIPNDVEKPLPEVSLVASLYAQQRQTFENGDYALGVNCGIDSAFVEIGICHNKILHAMIDDNIESVSHRDYGTLTKVERSIVESNEFTSGYTTIVDNNDIYNFKLQSRLDGIMDLFGQALEKGGTSQYAVCQIVYNYTQTVRQASGLSLEDKECMYSAFAVAAYSYQHWSRINVD